MNVAWECVCLTLRVERSNIWKIRKCYWKRETSRVKDQKDHLVPKPRTKHTATEVWREVVVFVIVPAKYVTNTLAISSYSTTDSKPLPAAAAQRRLGLGKASRKVRLLATVPASGYCSVTSSPKSHLLVFSHFHFCSRHLFLQHWTFVVTWDCKSISPT